jgi:hypothetical protein
MLRKQFVGPSSTVHLVEVTSALFFDVSRDVQSASVRRDRIHASTSALVIRRLTEQDPKLQFHADVKRREALAAIGSGDLGAELAWSDGRARASPFGGVGIWT